MTSANGSRLWPTAARKTLTTCRSSSSTEPSSVGCDSAAVWPSTTVTSAASLTFARSCNADAPASLLSRPIPNESVPIQLAQCRFPGLAISTHTHPFDGPFSGTTWVSRYQKGKTNLDFSEAGDSEWQWHQTDNHTSTPPLSFYRPDALPAVQPTASKHSRHFQC